MVNLGHVVAKAMTTAAQLQHKPIHDESTTGFALEETTTGSPTTTPHPVFEWLGAHEVISITFVLLFILITGVIAAIYYIYKRSPCCQSCRKEETESSTPKVKIPENLSEIFAHAADNDRIVIERCDSDDSIKKF